MGLRLSVLYHIGLPVMSRLRRRLRSILINKYGNLIYVNDINQFRLSHYSG